jgi:Tol biopolymer transport system component
VNIEDRLRDALGNEPGSDSTRGRWDGVRERARRVRSRRQRTRATIALVAVLAIAGGLVSVLSRDDPGPNVAVGPVPSAEIAALVGDQLVVLSADDGHVVRVLQNGIKPALTFGGITATPDGQSVYFTKLVHRRPCDTPTIVRVPVAGGPEEVLSAPAAHPLVSPDGRTLAFANGACGSDGAYWSLVLHNLRLGSTSVDQITSVDIENDAGSLEVLSWSPDSQRVLVGTYGHTEPNAEMPLIKVFDRATSQFTPLAVTEATDTAAFLPDGRIIVSLHLDEGGHRIVELNEDGSLGKTLLETKTAGVLHAMRVGPDGELLLHFGGSILQTWRIGSKPKTILSDYVRDAVWLPAPRGVERDPQRSPDTFFTVRRDGAPSMVEMSLDGQLKRVITSDPTVVDSAYGLSITADRRYAFVNGHNFQRDCGAQPLTENGAVLRVDLATGTSQPVVNGRDGVVSPDGNQLAYVSVACDGDDQVAVHDLVTGLERFWKLPPSSPGVVDARPLAWDKDGKQFVVRVIRDGGWIETWFVDTSGSELEDRRIRIGGENDGFDDVVPLGRTGRWAGIPASDPRRVVEFDPSTGGGRTLFRLRAAVRVDLLSSNAAGNDLLLLYNPSANIPVLMRWREGDDYPERIELQQTVRIFGAAW